MLAENPSLGRIRCFHNRRLHGIRSRQVSGFENYLIFNRALPDGIQVLHEYHGARDIESLFEEE